MATEWFVVDLRTQRIVNCVTTSNGRDAAQLLADGMINGEHLAVTDCPTCDQLKNYRYWNERP